MLGRGAPVYGRRGERSKMGDGALSQIKDESAPHGHVVNKAPLCLVQKQTSIFHKTYV